MNENTLRAPGRNITIGEAVRKLNPHLNMSPQHILPPSVTAASLVAGPRTAEEKLNKTERRFLQRLRESNERLPTAFRTNIRIQEVTLKLAEMCRYTPDFSENYSEPCECHANLHITFYEVKGAFVRDDAWVKLKLAAKLYPEFTFILAQWKDGQWTETVMPK